MVILHAVVEDFAYCAGLDYVNALAHISYFDPLGLQESSVDAYFDLSALTLSLISLRPILELSP